jgi:serine/threonine protein kinase
MPIVKWLEKIDEGAFAEVWKAEDDLGRTVAVKLLDPSAQEFSSALDHAKALARAKHPNVVDVYYVTDVSHPITTTNTSAIVMELLNGEPLDKLLAARRLTVQEVQSIGQQIVKGLNHIHNTGLAHGDLHPRNVMVEGTCVKIIDILYRDTLSLLSSKSRQARLRSDCLQLKMLLADLLEHSELDFGVVKSFNSAASDLTTPSDILDAFMSASDPEMAEVLDKRLGFAFETFCDPHFADTTAYAAALDEETDTDIVFPLLTRIVDAGATRREHVHYIASLWNRLSEKQQADLLKKAARKLDTTVPDRNWYPHILLVDTLGPNAWLRLPKLQRLRIESIMTKNILTGRYDIHAPINRGGELGTWVRDQGHMFDDRDGLIENICTMLHRDWYTQNYIGKYLMSLLPKLADTPRRERRLRQALNIAVFNDAKVVKRNLHLLPDAWKRELEE